MFLVTLAFSCVPSDLTCEVPFFRHVTSKKIKKFRNKYSSILYRLRWNFADRCLNGQILYMQNLVTIEPMLVTWHQFQCNNFILRFAIRDDLCRITLPIMNISNWYWCDTSMSVQRIFCKSITLICQRSRSQRRNITLEKVSLYLKNGSWENFHIFFLDTRYNTLLNKK